MTRPIDPPTLKEDDVVLYDGPGRCGGIDSHSYHYTLVKRHGLATLLVKHGAGEEAIRLSLYGNNPEAFYRSIPSNTAYWILNAVYHAYRDGRSLEKVKANSYWEEAAAENRIKIRKVRGTDRIRVWVERKREVKS